MTRQHEQANVPVVLAGKYQIKPEKRQRFIELAKAGVEPTRAEPGNISYSFYEEEGVSNSFLYFEEWKNREALTHHLQQSYITPLLAEILDLVEEKPKVRVYVIEKVTHGI